LVKNGTWQGTVILSNSNKPSFYRVNWGLFLCFNDLVILSMVELDSANFGQRPFAYTPPSGFLKLNTFNLPDSTIEDGSDYFTYCVVRYRVIANTGEAGIDGVVNFTPDLVWKKSRSLPDTVMA
jgi:hypothetical protein